ncbi:MAG: FkbM family methyltransferase [Caulobacteraceae bacterium]
MKAFVQRAIRTLGYNVEGIHYTPRQLLEPGRLRALEFDDIVCRHMHERGRELSFVQIGAYDGVSTDPLRKYITACGWSGVMLEPQPRPVARLRELYAGESRIAILEAAVDRERGARNLYTVECDDLPKWAGGMASFQREHLLKHDYIIPGIGEKIRELTVNCITFGDVLDQMPGAQLDVLQIDAEGADGYLLSLFPFDRAKPAIIHWEIKNMDRAQQEAALDLVCGHGYLVARSGGEDMLAVLPEGRG